MKPQKLIKAIKAELETIEYQEFVKMHETMYNPRSIYDSITIFLGHLKEKIKRQEQPWHWPRATDADRGKVCWARDWDGGFVMWQKRVVLTHDYSGIEGSDTVCKWDFMIMPDPQNPGMEPPASVLEES